ncbi:hypothetical protein ANCCAN_20594 [Ancylostoma caninum]|uniref:Uncharacterized protein n=1 Tax=Ancylostoma caninum TaxID=29170 RepID=A0A368FND4_ANCCA|nr:hypothetical protein ANCCAN_20594 [Ancylostoma caninum]
MMMSQPHQIHIMCTQIRLEPTNSLLKLMKLCEFENGPKVFLKNYLTFNVNRKRRSLHNVLNHLNVYVPGPSLRAMRSTLNICDKWVFKCRYMRMVACS